MMSWRRVISFPRFGDDGDLEGRGFPGPEGLDYIQLDLTHLGRRADQYTPAPDPGSGA